MKTFSKLFTAAVLVLGYSVAALAEESKATTPKGKLAAPSGLTVRVVPDSAPVRAANAPSPMPTPAPMTSAATPAPAPKPLPPDLAKSKEIEEANRAHIRSTTYVAVESSPPPSRPEAAPAEPSPGKVWQPGYWKPVDGNWTWVSGEWDIPPTPESVWIDPSYDPDTKHWSAGYWQPDRDDSYEPVARSETPPPKLYGEKPAGSGLFY